MEPNSSARGNLVPFQPLEGGVIGGEGGGAGAGAVSYTHLTLPTTSPV